MNSKNNLDCILYNFQNKFPNASTLIIQNKNKCDYYNPEVQLKIIENPESTIDKFKLSKNLNGIIEFYINSFETLKEINLTFNYDIMYLLKKFYLIS